MSKKAWSPGRMMRSVKLCGCGLQRSPEMALIASTSSEPSSVEHLVRLGDDVVLAHARLQLLVDHVIDAVDHGRGLVQQHDLVDVLDLARVEHDLLAVDDLHAGLLQLEEHRRLGEIDADRHVGDAGAAQQSDMISSAWRFIRPAAGGTVPRMPSMPARHVVRHQPVAIEAVVDGGRAEVPHDRLAARAASSAKRQSLSRSHSPILVRGDVADVVDVEEQAARRIATRSSAARARASR